MITIVVFYVLMYDIETILFLLKNEAARVAQRYLNKILLSQYVYQSCSSTHTKVINLMVLHLALDLFEYLLDTFLEIFEIKTKGIFY